MTDGAFQRRPVLVTGAHGAIGRAVALRLATQGWNVAGLGHGDWTPADAARNGVASWTSGDVTLAALRNLGVRPAIIIHCAGSGSVGASLAEPLRDFQRTVDTTVAVLEFLRTDCPDGRLVLPSSAAVYGIASELPMREDMESSPASPYGLHKKIAEELVGDYARRYQLNAVIVRLFSVYGEGFRKQLLWDACDGIARHKTEFFGTGGETRDWLHATDAARLLAVAAEHASAACPVVNGGYGQPVAVHAIVEEIFRLMGRDGRPRFCGTQRPGDPLHYHADMRRAHAWGWQPEVGWREGLARYVEWFLRQRDVE